MIEKINSDNFESIAEKLSSYWKTRNMDYDKNWALNYLKKGHSQDIKEDLFFQYKNPKLKGIVSLFIFVGELAEIRDEVIFEENNEEFKNMIKEIENLAIQKNIRKIYSLSLKEKIQNYEDLGFEEEGRLKNHFIENEDVYVMSKFL